MNTTADGRRIKMPDVAGQTTEWQLQYSGLSDVELNELQQFFAAMGGTLNSFTFLDPCGNLLAWSDDPSQSEWQKSSFLTLTGAVSDPTGGKNAWQVINSGAGPQSLSQTLNAPGGYLYCLSVYVRAAQATTVKLSLGTKSAAFGAGTAWTRIMISGTGNSEDTSISCGMEVAAGAAIVVYGPQVEPQPAASAYQGSTTGGVYETARFRDDVFEYTSTDVNRHNTTVNILYANHL